MSRTVFLVGAAIWLLAGIGGIAVGAVGTESLLSLLPPLAIDAAALGGALTAVALALLAIGVMHLVVVGGIANDRRWASSAGVLLASALAILALALAATAVASALRDARYALPLIGAAALAAVGAAVYAYAAVRLAGQLGSGSVS